MAKQDKTEMYLSLLSDNQRTKLAQYELNKHYSQVTTVEKAKLAIIVRNFVSDYFESSGKAIEFFENPNSLLNEGVRWEINYGLDRLLSSKISYAARVRSGDLASASHFYGSRLDNWLQQGAIIYSIGVNQANSSDLSFMTFSDTEASDEQADQDETSSNKSKKPAIKSLKEILDDNELPGARYGNSRSICNQLSYSITQELAHSDRGLLTPQEALLRQQHSLLIQSISSFGLGAVDIGNFTQEDQILFPASCSLAKEYPERKF